MKLTATQLVILNAASKRDRYLALPFPDSLRVRGGAATKVVDAMVARGLLAETPVRAGEPVWSETDDGAITPVATEAGLSAICIEPDGADEPAAETAPDAAPRARHPLTEGQGRPEGARHPEGRPSHAQGEGRGAAERRSRRR